MSLTCSFVPLCFPSITTCRKCGNVCNDCIFSIHLIASVLLYNVATSGAAAAGNLVATYNFGTEGLEVYVPGSGILFDAGVYLDLTATPGVTITFT